MAHVANGMGDSEGTTAEESTFVYVARQLASLIQRV